MKPLSRFILIGILLSLCGLAVAGQLIRIQTDPRFTEVGIVNAKQYGYTWKILEAERGRIYDRWGRLLAGSREVYEIGLDRGVINNPETIADVLTQYCSDDMEDYLRGRFGDDYREEYWKYLYNLADKPYTGKNGEIVYYVLADFIPPADVREIQKLQKQYLEDGITGLDAPSLYGLVFVPHLQRTYPEYELAAVILGFFPFKDRLNGEGMFGIEGNYNNLLTGKPYEVYMPRNPYAAEEMPAIPRGVDLILTIDREIQAMVEAELNKAIQQSGATSGTVIVMDPRNGEILAMASTPTFDPNLYWQYPEVFPKAYMFNRAISEPFEPGSVFKILTMAAAIDSGAVKYDDVFVDTGIIYVGGVPIFNWDGSAWGPQTMTGCMQHSLNVCLAHVAVQLGQERFYDYLLNHFDIGTLTNIDLAGEVTYRPRTPNSDCSPNNQGNCWYPVDLAANSFGQGITVTPIQLVKGVSSVANHGKMVTPHVVRYVVKDNQQIALRTYTSGDEAIKPETAQIMTEMLAYSLEEEASNALVPGYRIAGKTGTAQIPGPGGYLPNVTNASFIGWGPVDDPHFMVYVWLERPQSSEWGSVVAAPVFATIFKNLTVLTNLPPDTERQRLMSLQFQGQ